MNGKHHDFLRIAASEAHSLASFLRTARDNAPTLDRPVVAAMVEDAEQLERNIRALLAPEAENPLEYQIGA